MGAGSTVYDRHYRFVEDWAAARTAPEPSSLLIVAMGISMTLTIGWLRRRRTLPPHPPMDADTADALNDYFRTFVPLGGSAHYQDGAWSMVQQRMRYAARY